MTNEKIEELKNGFNTAFLNSAFHSNLAYRPQLVFNDSKKGQKVFSAIEEELLKCDSFAISVAFITKSGITPLLQTLKELEKRKVAGRILTTDYLNFSDPAALDTLASLSNIELRMYHAKQAGNGFHTKGYIFQKHEEYRFIIGSSNLTQDALTRNVEWNTRLTSTDQGEMIAVVLEEFEKLWSMSEYTKDYKDFIEEYRREYEKKQLFDKLVAEQKRIVAREAIPSMESYKLRPNSMQKTFIHNLVQMRSEGIEKALLISSTGERDIFVTGGRNLGFTRVSEAWS